MMSGFEDYSYTVGRPYLAAGEWVHEGTHRASLYRHPAGLVEVDEYLGGKTPITAMRFTWQRQTHCRRWERSWGDRTLARLARELIEAVAR